MERLIEKQAEYRGHKFEVVLNKTGYRCGYVFVSPPNDGYFDAAYFDFDVPGLPIYDYESIGFECSCYGDLADIEAVRAAWGGAAADSCAEECERTLDGIMCDGVLWTTEMVEDACKSLIDQIVKLIDSPIKIVRADAEILEFSDGTTITSGHYQDCCERNYADFAAIDDLAREWEFRHPLSFEASEYGFRFGNEGKMVFVPCYSEQNGYYSYDVDIYYNGVSVLDGLECRDAQIIDY